MINLLMLQRFTPSREHDTALCMKKHLMMRIQHDPPNLSLRLQVCRTAADHMQEKTRGNKFEP